MKNATFQSFTNAVGDAGRALVRAGRFGIAAIATLSWPALLACAIALALFLTILPLALFLFVAFVAAKVVLAAIARHTRRRIQG